MRTNTKKILGAAAVAALVATGGSAFTASNTVAADKRFGFGSTSVTGVVTTAMTFVPDAGGDASKVASVDYTLGAAETSINEDNATAVIKYGTSAPSSTRDCVIVASVADGAAGSIKCALPANSLVSSLEIIQLVVTPQAAANGS